MLGHAVGRQRSSHTIYLLDYRAWRPAPTIFPVPGERKKRMPTRRFFVAKIGYYAYMNLFKRRFHLKNILGRKGEDEASHFLRHSGFRILERNYRNTRGRSLGEIDIIARDNEGLVFVEVKARTAENVNDELPETAITRKKLHRLSRIAEAYLLERHLENEPYRFDALSIRFYVDGRNPEIRHLRNIFL
jgi:putative endonuclease